MKWLQLLFAYLPSVLATVVAVENTLGSTVPGTSKKQIVLDVIQSGTTAASQIPEAHVQGIATLIDVLVATLNKSGVFAHGAAPVVVAQ